MSYTASAGERLRSVKCSTEIIVVKAPTGQFSIECGDSPMIPLDAEQAVSADDNRLTGEGTQIGKRYADPSKGLEVMCTKAGAGSLSVDATPLVMVRPKLLPSSD